MSSLQASEDLAAQGATAPRVTLHDLKAAVATRIDLTGAEAAHVVMAQPSNGPPWPSVTPQALALLSICILVTTSGFTIVGKSAPASPENYDREKGRQFAYDDAIRQLWPLEGYALRKRLAERAAFDAGPKTGEVA